MECDPKPLVPRIRRAANHEYTSALSAQSTLTDAPVEFVSSDRGDLPDVKSAVLSLGDFGDQSVTLSHE